MRPPIQAASAPKMRAIEPNNAPRETAVAGRVRSRGGLALGLVDNLPVLLLVLGDLRACLLVWDVLGLGDRLGRAVARRCLAGGVTRNRRAEG